MEQGSKQIEVKWYAANYGIGKVLAYCTEEMIVNGNSYPNGMTPEEWKKILGQIWQAGVLLRTQDEWEEGTEKKNRTIINKGMKLLAKHIHNMWD